MPINVRQKGATGEREIALQLNGAIGSVMRELGYPEAEVSKGFAQVQRNQNQSAVGGKDLVGTFNLCVEVKRQEQLAVNTWWTQCCDTATREQGIPVLLWRQNNGKWRCRVHAALPLPGTFFHTTYVEISWEQFYDWFRQYARLMLSPQPPTKYA